jgi:DNA-binding transcriptional LysR family regulator
MAFFQNHFCNRDLRRDAMEMHQVRYFLGVARTLNFTRAAEECNVSQPSLTRAIRQLEEELGGDLLLRERPHAQLTDLGRRMEPLLRQCYESALGARSLASSIKSGEIGSLRIALSGTIDTTLLMPHIVELRKQFARLEIKLLRGTAAQIAEVMKAGDAELAVASSLDNAWDRLDAWSLFTENFVLVANDRHQFTSGVPTQLSDLRNETLLIGTYCENCGALADLLRRANLDVDHAHELPSERDLAVFLEQDLGIAFVPQSTLFAKFVMRAPVAGLDLRRTVSLYGVAGRQRTPTANMIMKMLRAADWSRFAT